MEIQMMEHNACQAIVSGLRKQYGMKQDVQEFFDRFICKEDAVNYLKILCNQEELDVPWLLPSYLHAFTAPFSLLALVSEELSVTQLNDLSETLERSESSLMLPTKGMKGQIAFIIKLIREVPNMQIDALWQAVFPLRDQKGLRAESCQG